MFSRSLRGLGMQRTPSPAAALCFCICSKPQESTARIQLAKVPSLSLCHGLERSNPSLVDDRKSRGTHSLRRTVGENLDLLG